MYAAVDDQTKECHENQGVASPTKVSVEVEQVDQLSHRFQEERELGIVPEKWFTPFYESQVLQNFIYAHTVILVTRYTPQQINNDAIDAISPQKKRVKLSHFRIYRCPPTATDY